MQLITCPNCHHQFEPTDAIRTGMEKELRSKMLEWQQKKDEEYRGKEADFQKQLQLKEIEVSKKLEHEKHKLANDLQEQIRKQISGDYENQLKLLQQSATETEERLKTARQRELEFLKKEQALNFKEAEMEIATQKLIIEEKEKIKNEILQQEKIKNESKETEMMLKIKELEKKNEDTLHMLEEAKRKSEQGSMQLQGEVQELALEELLRSSFPFDEVKEVGKGVRGADCIQTVRNNLGQPCGEIIFESKRTKNFDKNWIDKLKADMRQAGAEVAVIVTTVMPTDLQRFGFMEGVWVCTFAEVIALTHALRDGILKVYTATKSQENRGDKMTLLYNYLTSNEFGEQWNAIREGFTAMRKSIQDERNAMEKLWKAREKQLEKVLLNAAHIKGSMEGISGQDSIELGLLIGNDDN